MFGLFLFCGIITISLFFLSAYQFWKNPKAFLQEKTIENIDFNNFQLIVIVKLLLPYVANIVGAFVFYTIGLFVFTDSNIIIPDYWIYIVSLVYLIFCGFSYLKYLNKSKKENNLK